MKQAVIIIGTVFIFLSCSQKKSVDDQTQLGDIQLYATVSEKAKPALKEAMLLLHSFEYTDAAEKFRDARNIDPDCAMAYWGEAMTHNHTLWREQNFREAKEVIELLGETKEEQRSRFKTEYEKDMFDALSVLYGSGSKNDRDKAYSEYMAELYKKYPDNNEVASLYALSILGAVKGGRDYEAYAKGARIAESVIEENPSHPGALHYLIHSYDDPDNAPKALEAANRYSNVAPAAGHALHMPSHIYVALGMWNEVIRSNIESWEASKKRKINKELDNDALNYHAFKWLMYGHLQLGEFVKARNVLSDMQAYAYELPSSRSANHLVMMKAAYFTETGDWSDSLFYDTLDYNRFSFQTQTIHTYLLGMKAYHMDAIDQLQMHRDSMFKYIQHSTNAALSSTGPMCSGNYSWTTPTELDVSRANVLCLELDAAIALLKKDIETAEQLMKRAVALEQETSYNYGPPEIVKPASEFYAEWLIEQGRIDEAREQLNLVLERAPGRLIPTDLISKLPV